jgi:hypothetical protein
MLIPAKSTNTSEVFGYLSESFPAIEEFAYPHYGALYETEAGLKQGLGGVEPWRNSARRP